MDSFRYMTVTVFLVGAMLLGAAPASAQTGEVSLAVGALLGDDLDVDPDRVERAFDDAPVFGGRIGSYGHPWGIEASFLVSPSGVPADGAAGEIDVQVIYAEANALLIFLPGPVSPFVTGGAGLHRFSFERGASDLDVDDNRLGFNFGGGVKANIGSVVLRADVRDHVTPFDTDDLDAALVRVLGVGGDQTLHNWEVSAGIGVRF